MNSQFFDTLKSILKVETDTDLSRELGFAEGYIRHVRTLDKVPAKLEIAVLEATNWTLWEMREKMRECV